MAEDSSGKSEPKPQEAAASPPGADRKYRPRILVCDDSATVRIFIQQLLKTNYDVQLAPTAEDGLKYALQSPPDLIISDLVMPGMNGYELCQKVRAESSLANTPIILLTSITEEEARATGLEAGADDYLFKPVRPRELLARTASLLRLRAAHQELVQQSMVLAERNRRLQQMQGQLLEAEKLAAIGTLVTGIAHEINNPLSVVMSSSTNIGETSQEMLSLAREASMWASPDTVARVRGRLEALADECREMAGEVVDGAKRIQRIATDLRRSASQQADQMEEVDLASEVNTAWTQALAKSRGTPPKLALQLDELKAICISRPMLNQVLTSILENAVQAMAGAENPTVSVKSGRGGKEGFLRIRDSGPGIDPAHLSKIFDPFFTTKPPGQGTGLGLTVTHGAVRRLGGRIEVESQPGQGAEFTVWLPSSCLTAASWGQSAGEALMSSGV